jgi:acyl carrier protein
MNMLASEDGLPKFLALVRSHVKLLDEAQELGMDAPLEPLGLDSSAALNLMLDLEEAFGVVFDDSLFTEETFATPRSLWQSLAALRNG